MLDSEIVQKKEELRQKEKDLLGVYRRELDEARKSLDKAKKERDRIANKYREGIIVDHREALEVTRNHSEQLLKIEKRLRDEAIRHEETLLEINSRSIAARLDVVRFRTRILEQYHRSQESRRQQGVETSVKDEKVKIGKVIKRLKLMVTNKIPEMIEFHISFLKPALIAFQLEIPNMTMYNQNLYNRIGRNAMEASYILEDIHNEFQMDQKKDLTKEVDKLVSCWSNIQNFI